MQMLQFVESKTTKSYVAEMQDAATFYLNKILVANKSEGDKGKPHLEFVQNFKKIGEKMQIYVKEFHTTGLAWNPKGEDVLKVLNSPSSTGSSNNVTSSSSGDLPPPPPPVDHEKLRKLQEDAVKKNNKGSSGSGDSAALFNQINAIDGEGKKNFLKHVGKEERNLYSKAVEKGENAQNVKEQPKKRNNNFKEEEKNY